MQWCSQPLPELPQAVGRRRPSPLPLAKVLPIALRMVGRRVFFPSPSLFFKASPAIALAAIAGTWLLHAPVQLIPVTNNVSNATIPCL